MLCLLPIFFLFFFNDTATTEIYTLSLHDALPISTADQMRRIVQRCTSTGTEFKIIPSLQDLLDGRAGIGQLREVDRKSTRLNSSHQIISYAVFCLKKKKN